MQFILNISVANEDQLKTITIIWLSLLLCLIPLTESLAQLEDYKVKAGWILALIQYTTWKDRSVNNITICTIGRDELGVFLRQIKKDKSLPITIEEKSYNESLSGCHIVSIGATQEKEVSDILQNTKDLPILTVSTIKGFAEMGGIIEFITNGKNVSLLINVGAAKRAHIIIGSALVGISQHIN